MLIITNAFSLSMLDGNFSCKRFEKITQQEAAQCFNEYRNNYDSYIGHKDTGSIVADMLGYFGTLWDSTRRSYVDKDGDFILVAQYSGTRLPEGSTTLPQGAKIEFWLVQEQRLLY